MSMSRDNDRRDSSELRGRGNGRSRQMRASTRVSTPTPPPPAPRHMAKPGAAGRKMPTGDAQARIAALRDMLNSRRKKGRN